MALIITKNKEIKEYYKSNRISQSLLKKLHDGLDSYLESKDKDISNLPSVIKGSAVDTILLSDDFDDEFYVISDNTLSIKEMEILDIIYQKSKLTKIDDLEKYIDIISDTVTELNWQPNWKLDTKINKIFSLCTEYFKEFHESEGKKILTQEQMFDVKNTVNSLKNNNITKSYFDRDVISSKNNEVTYYQLPIYFTLNNIKCKALIDIATIGIDSYGNAEYILLQDLKTMSGYTIDFINNLKKYRYDIQASFYIEGIMSKDVILPDGFPKITDNTVIKPFQFIVESTTNIGKPMVYEVTDEILSIGANGFVNSNGIKYYRGFNELLEDYKFYIINKWKIDSKLANYVDKKIIKINWNGIV